MDTLYVGIDIGAHFHVAALNDGNKSFKKFPTFDIQPTRESLEAFREWIEGYCTYAQRIVVALEPTGTHYSKAVAEWVKDQGYTLVMVDNKALHDYRAMVRNPAKDDWSDAKLLAKYASMGLDTVEPLGGEIQHLRYLCSEHRSLNRQRVRYKNQLHQMMKVTFPELTFTHSKRLLRLLAYAPTAKRISQLNPQGVDPWSASAAHKEQQESDSDNPCADVEAERVDPLWGKRNPWLESVVAMAGKSIGVDEEYYASRTRHTALMVMCLDERITALETEMRETVLLHPDGKILLSMPGVSHTTAAVLISTYGSIERYETKQCFKRRMGVAAERADSGVSVRKNYLYRRNSSHCRATLHMMCLSLFSHATAFKAYFERRRNNETKGHNKRIMGRVKGKIIEVIWALLRKREHYSKLKHQAAIEKASPSSNVVPLKSRAFRCKDCGFTTTEEAHITDHGYCFDCEDDHVEEIYPHLVTDRMPPTIA